MVSGFHAIGYEIKTLMRVQVIYK